MANKLNELMKEGDSIGTNEEFLAWNKKIHSFLDGNGYPTGLAPVNWVKGELGGDTVDGFFQGLKPSVNKAYTDLRRYSDEFDSSNSMGMKIDIRDPEVAVQDPKKKEDAIKLINDLRGVQRGFWYQYKQRGMLSRAVASGFDIDNMSAANKEIDGIIADIEKAKTPEQFEAVQARITKACKGDGAIHKGFKAAEMDGTQQIINLVQTIGEIVVITVATEGLGTEFAAARAAGEIGLEARSMRAGWRVFTGLREAAQAREAMSALELANIARYGSYAKDIEAVGGAVKLTEAELATVRSFTTLTARSWPAALRASQTPP